MIMTFNDHHYSNSVSLFIVASSQTTIFFIFYILYVLRLTDTIYLGGFDASYLVLFSWGSLVTFLLIPLPIFNHKGRIYVLKLFVESLFSPLIGVTFPTIVFIDQIVSLITPLKDFTYSICYYSRMSFWSLEAISNPCSDMSKFVLIMATSVFGYRLLQCINQGYDQGNYFCSAFFINTTKYVFSITAAILAYYY